MRAAAAALTAVFLAALPITVLPVRAATASEGDAYYTLIYDFEVAWICGLASQSLHDAYMERRRAIEASDGRDTEALRRTRIKAMAAAEREYDNRSLGGHAQWCAGEGEAGRRRIAVPAE